ncbi:MAG: hypothetical protein Q4E64_10300 [Phascolarctobacterium sp.]|uniref:hypothetical protein n=1 Tax=Phascolarctobacterium sp. TaxID=2049039 RepID=UPI0026DD6443|nr:hypothetical protein [Phascolarctobacterium sp.]MDO4922197.1 hypothetical protein [Phascolarctobacterium sp.]
MSFESFNSDFEYESRGEDYSENEYDDDYSYGGTYRRKAGPSKEYLAFKRMIKMKQCMDESDIPSDATPEEIAFCREQIKINRKIEALKEKSFNGEKLTLKEQFFVFFKGDMDKARRLYEENKYFWEPDFDDLD